MRPTKPIRFPRLQRLIGLICVSGPCYLIQAYTAPANDLVEVVERGLDSRYVPLVLLTYDSVVAKMAARLSSNEWLVGDKYSLADIAMLPYIARLEDLGLAWFWS